jgi:hypothetical protein
VRSGVDVDVGYKVHTSTGEMSTAFLISHKNFDRKSRGISHGGAARRERSVCGRLRRSPNMGAYIQLVSDTTASMGFRKKIHYPCPPLSTSLTRNARRIDRARGA